MAKFHKEMLDILKDWLGAIAMYVCYLLIPLLPLKVTYMIARTLSNVSLKFLKKPRNTIVGNMAVAFGTKMSEEEKMETAKEMVTNLLKGFFEGFYMASRFRKKVDGIISIEGREYLDQALSRIDCSPIGDPRITVLDFPASRINMPFDGSSRKTLDSQSILPFPSSHSAPSYLLSGYQ